MDVPALSDIRVRSPLLTADFPDPSGDDALTVLVLDSSVAASLLTGRAVGVDVGTVGPFGCPLEEVPPAFVPFVYRVVATYAERADVASGADLVRSRIENAEGGLASFTAGPYCVPMDTEALTPNGWRSYGDLCVGDLVLGFDPETETSRWTPITAIQPPVEADVVKVGNSRWSVRCTANHRWVTRDRWMQDGKYVEGPWRMRETKDLKGAKWDILTSAPADTEQQLPISSVEAAVISWLWTDGHLEMPNGRNLPVDYTGSLECAGCGAALESRSGRPTFCAGCRQARREVRTGFRGTITQKKYQREVEATLALAEAPHTVDASDEGCLRYRIRSAWMRDLWDRAQLWDLSPVEFVLRLGPEAREAFLEAGLLAEGSLPTAVRKTKARRGFGRFYRWSFSQNEGPVLDAFVVAAQLSGYGVRVKGRGRKSFARRVGSFFSQGIGRDFSFAVPTQGGRKMTVTPDGRELVWCVQTELGSWTMRQGDVVTLTGNSESYFGPAAANIERRSLDADPELAAILWALATDCVRVGWQRLWDPALFGAYPPARAFEQVNWFPEGFHGYAEYGGYGGFCGGPDGF